MRKILGVIAILIASLTNIYAQRSINKIVAVVGDNVILQSDIERDYANYILQGNTENPEVKCYLVQQMLTQKLLSQQAVIDSVTVTDDDVSSEVDRRMRVFVQRAGGQERLEKFLNRSVLQYKDEIRPDVREQMIAEKMRSKITENIAVTPLEVKRYFESIPKDSLPYYNTEVEIGEVVINPKLTKQEKESFRDKAEALRLRVKGGESFETLASVYSQDPGSAPEGGDLGFFDRTAMVKEFSAMAFKLKAGEVSPVFETDYGFHVLQVIERRGEQVHARHILIKTEPTNASLDRTKVHIDSIYRDVVAGKLPFATAASLFSDNNETKFSGGMLLNSEGVSSRTTYIPTDKLEPSVFLTVDTMKVGTYSKPELFTSKEGKQGYRFFYLKSKTQPHQANLDQDFPKLKEDAYQDKLNKKASEWFEKKRKQTYIKIDPEFQSCSSLKLWTSTN
ncbi:peptidylprolyl isomerase [Desertivirga arenae]|uniref:peptidylprolyl isomerase n=1 Tax=Desertivirga arenae TaxID=2810309 RepID=UPI001A9600F1|nr:peptidylprolyl isomerase [Pedobacter sp. SYSU D00823]